MSPAKPRICYLLPQLRLGGAEKHVIVLASELRRRGYDASIACLFQEGSLAADAGRAGVPLVCLGLKEGWWFSTLWPVYRWLRTARVDVLHTYLFGFHLFAGLPARALRIPAIVSSRRDIALWKKQRHHCVERLGNFFVDKVVCCSQAVKAWTMEKENIAPEKLYTIYNGVDLTLFDGKPPDVQTIRQRFGIPAQAPLVGTVANFSPDKGYPHLLNAAEHVIERCPEAYFLIVGSGPFFEDTVALAKRSSVRDRLVFAGEQQDIAGIVAALDCFVLASVTEGFPNAIMEAMAMARPIVATRVGGIPELIESGRQGILVAPRDGYALAQGILEVLGDSGKAAAMAACARERVEVRFTLSRMVDDYDRFYQALWATRVGT